MYKQRSFKSLNFPQQDNPWTTWANTYTGSSATAAYFTASSLIP